MRYAIAIAPPPTAPLWHQGSLWLGRDACSGQVLARPCFRGIDPERLEALTRTPARYGFQAALVPPFRLALPWSEVDLLQGLEDFTARQGPFALSALELDRFSSRFCLRPDEHHPGLQTLAAHAIRAFDRFRAPLTPGELARGKAAMLSGQEKRNLEIWGHPYVFEQFRFYFTLTAPMGDVREMERIQAALVETFGPLLAAPLPIDALCLFVAADGGEPMRCQYRFPFPPYSSEPEERIHHAPQVLQKNLYSRHQCHSA